MLEIRINFITTLAVVNGNTKQASSRLVDYLYKNRQKNKVSIVSENHKEGKKAVLDYSVIPSRDGLSLLSVKLQTGRSPSNSGSTGRNWYVYLGGLRIWCTIQ